MSELRPEDIRDNKNLHCTADEIDERQILELLAVLDEWEAGEMSPEDVMMHTSHIVGVRDVNFTWDYAYNLSNGLPGTPKFEKHLKDVPGYIERAWQQILQMDAENATSSVEHMVERYNNLKPEIQHKWLSEERQRLAQKQKETGYKPLERNADIPGPRGYVDTIHAHINYRDQARAEGNEYAVARAECDIIDRRKAKDEAERDFKDVPAAIERRKQKAIDEHEKTRERLRGKFRAEVLEDRLHPEITAHIGQIRQKIDDLEMASWDAAIAVAQLIINPEAKSSYSTHIKQFEQDVREEQKRCEEAYAPRDARETLDKLQPETEADFIKRYADDFAAEAKYQRWRRDRQRLFDIVYPRDNYPDVHEKSGFEELVQTLHAASDALDMEVEEQSALWDRITDFVRDVRDPKKRSPDAEWTKQIRDSFRATFSSWDSYTGKDDLEKHYWNEEILNYFQEQLRLEEKHELARSGDNDFRSPFAGYTDILCDEMHISPSGTARIKLTPSEDEHEMMGYRCADTARITTYAVSFKPKDPQRVEELINLVHDALEATAHIDHQYFYSPNDDDSYERASGRDRGYSNRWGNYARNYVFVEDGIVRVDQKLDLDDLYVLYYMLEPALEPSAQIAAAINAARYSEERGAVLAPDPLHGGQYDQGSYGIEEESGTLLGVPEEQLFAKAVRDAFVDLTLGKIDQAGFTARIQIIADHTLTGKMQDPHGTLPSYQKLIADQRKEAGGEVISYDDALKSRVMDIVRTTIGLPEDSDIPLSAAIIGFTHRIKPQLMEHFRAEAADRTRKIRHHFDSGAWRYQHSHADDLLTKLAKKRLAEEKKDEENPEGAQETLEWLNGHEMLYTLSDAFAGRTGGKHEKDAVAFKGNIVVRDSEVETCIDGIHILNDGTTYRTRTKDSLLPRKELPSVLKPFEPQNNPRTGLGFLALDIF